MRPRRAIAVHPEAAAEVRAARLWYQERNPTVAGRFRTESRRAIERAAAAPLRWPLYLEGTRRVPLHRFPYFVVYRKQSEGILMVALAHERQKPGYWGGR